MIDSWSRAARLLVMMGVASALIGLLPGRSTALAAESPTRPYYNQAKSYIQKGQYQAADDVLTMGLRKYPGNFSLLTFRGELRGDYMNRPYEAIADYTAALRLGGNHRAYMRRAHYFIRVTQYQSAVSDLTRAISLSPKYGKAYMMRAEAYGKLGMIREASADLKACVKYNPEYLPAARKLQQKLGLAGF